MIGGRVKFGESTKRAIIREFFEEIGINLDENKLNLIDLRPSIIKNCINDDCLFSSLIN